MQNITTVSYVQWIRSSMPSQVQKHMETKKLEERKRKLAQRDLEFNEYANNNCNFRCL